MALYFILFFIGLITGSFLNVVIWRYPIMCKQQLAEFQGDIDSSQPKISLVRPRSHCSYCRQTLRVYDIIPLFSWLILKGYCRNCHEKIGLRYPLTELLTAFSFLLAWFVWPANIWSVAVMILSALLIAASFIDIEHQWLPDVFTQGILWTGLIVAWTQQSPLSLHEAVTGVLAGFASFYSLRWGAGIVLRKESLGMGDVLLFAGLGGWVGASSLPYVALIASLSGLVYAVIMRNQSGLLPFGPCLSLGGLATLYVQRMCQ
ncbi:A24 family peptidase [Escherichia coli]|uniref:prepilin peptidase n=1 Tax=Escherichia TaxID=561 RepID=UPI001CE3EDCB|nr:MULTISPECIES: A24 family peptidase [Escherichia]UHR05232.1 A24 family peptidase [Escherichia coli]